MKKMNKYLQNTQDEDRLSTTQQRSWARCFYPVQTSNGPALLEMPHGVGGDLLRAALQARGPPTPGAFLLSLFTGVRLAW